MQADHYQIHITSKNMRQATSSWLILGFVSLIAAGIFSILLVLARTPAIGQWIPFADFFHTALVVHVNLSVFIWLLAFSAGMWSLSVTDEYPLWDKVSLFFAVTGTLVIIVSPFFGSGRPLLNNYMPVLQQPTYYAGLIMFISGIASHLIRALFSIVSFRTSLDSRAVVKFGISMSAIITAAAVLSFLASYTGLGNQYTGQIFFEFVFWGAGHVLQFSYTLLMIVCWIVLANSSDCRYNLSPRLTILFLILLVLPIITVPFLYLGHEIVSPGHRLAFTELMKYGGLSSLPLGLAIVVAMWNAENPEGEGIYLRSALNMSVLLFAVGGVLGFMISGLDIVIPAHYHGSTVAVTIAFMGLSYYLLPRLGFAPPPPRLTFWQPYIYGIGQLIHIAGLAVSGGYGVQRKASGLAQGLDRLGEIAGMAMMGTGGLISVIGGIVFLVIACTSIARPQS